ncbi:hypothetical protein C0Q70_19866 [Pomacea canaliculata]|uniref:Uncharacterized protein n=1 Tax=Pomacea canaliculata TaxID=400727 RepID=A0A2T7NDX6_POMCA|nr:hypothetical protein C0Q70_19866 [Pomacea canaliculata]
MATNGGQRFNFCNNCGTANVKVDVNTASIISEGKQEPVPVEMNIGNKAKKITADIKVNKSDGNPQQLPQQGPQVTGESRQCSEDTQARQAVSEASDNDGSTS